jgi:hypothetical protein
MSVKNLRFSELPHRKRMGHQTKANAQGESRTDASVGELNQTEIKIGKYN